MTNEYQVLARKYRPTDLSGLIGQEAMVRTLTHAIEQDRIPHAFILTGIRGVGKTSTARIIARSLVCIGKDGKSDKPTTAPCGECENCKSIAQSRHVDVLEVDAASQTGVDNIREIIENVQYKPVLARYKIYIIDEVHMLSKGAFNALLKTLEEPPEHAKFIFATTEIRKIPVTVLSRCMRFDLPRVPVPTLMEHFGNICKQEDVKMGEDALQIIAGCAEGSVRDGLSLIDQAIGMHDGKGTIDATAIRTMLGMADRLALYDLMQSLVKGEVEQALAQLRAVYTAGGEPEAILQDLLEISHLLTQYKVVKNLDDQAVPAEELKRISSIGDGLALPYIARLWQMLLKGIEEIKLAPISMSAAEMILIRIAYSAHLPTPDDLIKKMQNGSATNGASNGASNGSSQPSAPQESHQPQAIHNFPQLVTMCDDRGERFIATWLREVKLVHFDANQRKLEFEPVAAMPKTFAGDLGEKLRAWTGEQWFVIVSSAQNEEESLRSQDEKNLADKKQAAAKDPFVQAALAVFPGAEITKIEEMDDENEQQSQQGGEA